MVAMNHGTLRAYRAGCRCDECKAANTDAKRRERERRRERAGKPAPRTHPKKSVPTPTKKGADVPTVDPTAGPIETAARAALESVATDGDLVMRLRVEIVVAAARNLDTPKLQYQFRANAETLRAILADIVSVSPEKGGEVNALADLVGKIRSASRD